MKCLKNHIIFTRRRKLVEVDVGFNKDGKKLKKRVRYTSSSFSSVITTGQTDTQQLVEETQDNYAPNVKIIHVQPL